MPIIINDVSEARGPFSDNEVFKVMFSPPLPPLSQYLGVKQSTGGLI